MNFSLSAQKLLPQYIDISVSLIRQPLILLFADYVHIINLFVVVVVVILVVRVVVVVVVLVVLVIIIIIFFNALSSKGSRGLKIKFKNTCKSWKS